MPCEPEPGRNPGCACLWLQEIAAVMPPLPPSSPPPPPKLAQLVFWPGSGWDRLEKPGIAQPGQGTGRMERTLFMSLWPLGCCGQVPSSLTTAGHFPTWGLWGRAETRVMMVFSLL